MIIAAALCPSPPMLIPGLTGAARVLPELGLACQQVVAELIAADPDVVAVVGPGARTMTWDPAARLDVAAFAPGLGAGGSGGSTRGDDPPEPHTGSGLPMSLGVGEWLLDQAGYVGERQPQSVAHLEPAERCARIGADLAAASGRTALLVLADGSACRNPKAPGYFDERSAGFDAEVERAVRAGDLGALLAIDAELASELMATGRPAWQVLAGALNGDRLTTQVRYCNDPFGVAYLVASLRVGRS